MLVSQCTLFTSMRPLLQGASGRTPTSLHYAKLTEIKQPPGYKQHALRNQCGMMREGLQWLTTLIRTPIRSKRQLQW